MAMLFSAQSQTISLPAVCHRAITGMTMTLEREKFTFQSTNQSSLAKIYFETDVWTLFCVKVDGLYEYLAKYLLYVCSDVDKMRRRIFARQVLICTMATTHL